MQNKRVRVRTEVKKIRKYTSRVPTARPAQAERFKNPRKRNKKKNSPQILGPRKTDIEFAKEEIKNRRQLANEIRSHIRRMVILCKSCKSR